MHVVRREVMFSLCPPTGGGRGGGGVSHLHTIILPTGSMSFPEDTPVTSPRSLPGGHPSPRQGSTPQPGQDEVPLPNQVKIGYPSQVRMGYPPPPRQIGYAWTGYAAGSTPLAVSRRRTFLCVNIILKF